MTCKNLLCVADTLQLIFVEGSVCILRGVWNLILSVPASLIYSHWRTDGLVKPILNRFWLKLSPFILRHYLGIIIHFSGERCHGKKRCINYNLSYADVASSEVCTGPKSVIMMVIFQVPSLAHFLSSEST